MLPLVEPWAECPACETETPRRALHVSAIENHRSSTGPVLCRHRLRAVRPCLRVTASDSRRPRRATTWTKTAWLDRPARRGLCGQRRKRRRRTSRPRAWRRFCDRAARGRALDVGCGAGDILGALKKAGWETVGIEPHAARRAIAEQHHRLIEEIPREPTFDLIIFHHVLEHVLAPCDLLRAARAASLPGAHLLVGVPAFEDAAITGNLARACGPGTHQRLYQGRAAQCDHHDGMGGRQSRRARW